MYMLSAGIHIFSRGFLLSRMTLEDANECAHMNLCDDVHNVSFFFRFLDFPNGFICRSPVYIGAECLTSLIMT